jgi:cytochrome c peroxidase
MWRLQIWGSFSSGFRGVQTKRNSPPTFNVAMNGQLFWDLRAPSLMEQVLIAGLRPRGKMGMSDMGHLIGKGAGHRLLCSRCFSAAFGSDEVTEEKIRIAIRDFPHFNDIAR